jgi:hypothetical protein
VQRMGEISRKSRLSFVLQLLGLAALAAALGGCGPEVSKSDLGTVGFDVPKVAGADKPFPMPKLTAPAPDVKKERDLLRTPLQ